MGTIKQIVLSALIVVGVLVLANKITTINNEIELKQLDLKFKQAEIENLEKQIHELELDDKSDSKRIEELKRENDRLQQELALKQAREAQTAKNAVFASAVKPLVAGCSDVRAKLAAHGITGAELDAAVELANNESSCNSQAVNPSSGACNLFQELPCGKWGGTNDVDAHIIGAIGRINGTYKGSWQYALSQFYARSPHWW